MSRITTLGVILAMFGTSPLTAQSLRLSGAGTLAQTRVRSEVSGVSERLQAMGIGFEAAARLSRAGLRIRYTQADLDPAAASALPREMVEADAALFVRPVRWLEAGPAVRVRSHETALGSQGWVLWELRARLESDVVPGVVRGFAEFGTAFASDVNVPEPFDNAYDGEIGFRVRIARTPFHARALYRLAFARFGDGVRRETLEGVAVAVTLGQW